MRSAEIGPTAPKLTPSPEVGMKTFTAVASFVALAALVAACDTHNGPMAPGPLSLNAELADYSGWSTPVNFGPVINSDSNETAPTFSTDGHHLYFHSFKAEGCGDADLYVARRHDKRDDLGWGRPENLGCIVNSPFRDAGPTIFDDEATGITTLMFTSTRPGGPGDFDIYQSTRVGDEGEFGPATLIAELSGPFRDTRTAISRDGLELFLSSDVTGRPNGVGGQDLWVATRATTADLWSYPVNLGPAVNTTAFDGAPALSFDGTTMYFFSNRAGGSGGNDIWVTTRARLRGQVVGVAAIASAPLVRHIVAPQTTDPAIDQALDNHYAWLDTAAQSNHTLLVFMPGQGQRPALFQLVQQEAARLGYHVVGLMYSNLVRIGTLCPIAQDP